MNTKEILGDKFESLIQIVKKFINPADSYLDRLAEQPCTAVESIDAVFSQIKSVIDDIKYDLDNNYAVDLNHLRNIRDMKTNLIEMRIILVNAINDEVSAARKLITEIEQM